MMIKFVVLLVLIAYVAGDRDAKWKDFKSKHGKKYRDSEHEARRQAAYFTNLEKVEGHNKEYDAGRVGYKLRIQSFSDKTHDEIRQTMTGAKIPPHSRALPQSFQSPADFPASTATLIDYRPCMQPIVNQQSCGCCWAFATIAQLEYLSKKKNPSFNTPLSQQQLVDCDTSNGGCNGGWMYSALLYLQSAGATKATDYPFISADGTCNTSPPHVTPNAITNVTQFHISQGLTETNMMNILAKDGPFAIGIEAGDSFMHYASGILDDATCGTCEGVNHAVVIVGYGTENGKKYWIIRNSWDTTWGESGYARILRDANTCGLACWAVYAT